MRGVLEVSRNSVELACSYSLRSGAKRTPKDSTSRQSALAAVSPLGSGYRLRLDTATRMLEDNAIVRRCLCTTVAGTVPP